MCLARRMNFSRKTSGTAECGLSLAPCLIEGWIEGTWLLDDSHAAPAAPHRRLDDDRVSKRLGHGMRLGARHNRRLAPGEDGYAGLVGQGPRCYLVAQQFE